jgi:hypothetical protein
LLVGYGQTPEPAIAVGMQALGEAVWAARAGASSPPDAGC